MAAFQGSGAFQVSPAFQTGLPTQTAAGDYGPDKKKKRKVILDGKRFDLTEAQLAEVLLQSLKEAPSKPAKSPDEPKPQPAKKTAQKPAKEAQATYPAYPAFDRLWDYFIQTKQHEIAAFMREIVQRQLDDEEDVLILLASL